ncbi:MAG: hypothetical protein AAF721_03110 [Myxococcota bacterium]
MRRTSLLASALCLAACDTSPRLETLAAPNTGDLGETAGESSGGEEDIDSDLDVEPLDVPAAMDFACQKIDFLFVIDDSGSMGDEQARLIDGFPGFISGVQEAIEQYDYQMMVVTTGYNYGASDPDDCSTAIGAGRIEADDGEACGVGEAEAGQRFTTAQDEGLTDVFECVADVGTTGFGDERPIWSMAQAITAQSGPNGCNAGFLRDDAILVVTIITDEEDDADENSPGDPALWKEVVVAAKHGDERSVVMLGLLGDTDLPDGDCLPFDQEGNGAEGAPRLREFVDSFEYGSWTSVCADDYTPFFSEAVGDIGAACTDFTPVP